MALKAAKRFKPGYPSFMTILKKHNLKRSFILNIPAEFSGENKSINVGNYIKLEDSHGGKWPGARGKAVSKQGMVNIG